MRLPGAGTKLVLLLVVFSLTLMPGTTTRADLDAAPPEPVQLLPIVADKVVPSNHAPGTPYPLQPLDGVTDHDPVFVQFRWQSIDPDGDVLVYDVLFEADDPTPDEYLVRETGYQQIGAMLWGSTDYYWQVVSRDQRGGVSPSPVWHFSTAPCDSIWLNFEITDVQGLEITLDTRVSSLCSNLTKVEWHWGDGLVDSVDNPQLELSISHTYTNTGLCNLEVIAYNDQGISVSESQSIYRGPASGVCDYVTGIPDTECDALVSIYENMDGPNWTGAHGWNLYTTPCADYQGWEGVKCLDGHVDRLNLFYEYIKGDLPADIQDLTELRYFGISGRFTSIPPEIGNLSKLQSLGLYYSDITMIPPEIGNLGELTMLKLDSLDITQLPSTIGNLTNLERFEMQYTQVTTLPAEIGNLSNLNYMNLDINEISSLPDEIGNLNNLTTLEIRGNPLVHLPDTFSSQSLLEHLDLGANDLVSIPDSIGNLERLTYLDISSNPISVLPDTIGQCESLERLFLNETNVITLPATIGNLHNLEYLGAEHCALTALPEQLSQCSMLRDLDVSHNMITGLPEDLGNMTALYRLTADNNLLTTLPASIGNLDWLFYVDVYSNTLSSLPPEIGQIAYLNQLDVHGNPDLMGPVPDFLITLENMNSFSFYDTNWCEPTTGPVADWLASIHYDGTGVPCTEASAIQMCLVDG